MPNHVHLLMTPLVEVSKVMQSLKRFTAREGNRILSLTGQPFWQDESYDRLVRNQIEFARRAHYIEMNPVNAGLASAPEDFRWSSAGRPRRLGRLKIGRRLETCPTMTGWHSDLPLRAAQLIAEEMTLRELRKARRLTQVRMARALGITQDGVSRLKKRSDLLLSTLPSRPWAETSL
jgi:hypothetical protein